MPPVIAMAATAVQSASGATPSRAPTATKKINAAKTIPPSACQIQSCPGCQAWTSSGATGLRIARERAEKPLLTLSPNISTGRRLALVWGVHAVLTEDAKDVNDMVERGCRHAYKDGFARPGQRVLIVAGVPFGTPGATNMMRIAFVGTDDIEGA